MEKYAEKRKRLEKLINNIPFHMNEDCVDGWIEEAKDILSSIESHKDEPDYFNDDDGYGVSLFQLKNQLINYEKDRRKISNDKKNQGGRKRKVKLPKTNTINLSGKKILSIIAALAVIGGAVENQRIGYTEETLKDTGYFQKVEDLKGARKVKIKIIQDAADEKEYISQCVHEEIEELLQEKGYNSENFEIKSINVTQKGSIQEGKQAWTSTKIDVHVDLRTADGKNVNLEFTSNSIKDEEWEYYKTITESAEWIKGTTAIEIYFAGRD